MDTPLRLPADLEDALPESIRDRAATELHRQRCDVCMHEDAREIEACYVAWAGSVEQLARTYNVRKLHLRRHAAVFLLDEVRGAGIGAYLTRILERQLPQIAASTLTFEQVLALCDRLAVLSGAAGPREAIREIERGAAATTAPRLIGSKTWEQRVREAGRGAA